jgi:hypothetical protein
MKLSSKVLGLFAAAAMIMSVTAPLTTAQSTAVPGSQRSSSASVREDGTLTGAHLWSNLTFGTVGVTSQTGGKTSPEVVIMDLTDNRAYSHGWTVQLSASDLVEQDDANRNISSENLLVSRNTASSQSGFGRQCDTNEANTSNPYQTPEMLVTAGNAKPVGSGIDVMSAKNGRGCGLVRSSLKYELNVPAGQYTGGGTAVYNGTVTVTTMAPVGN